jgi:uncharacterized membrane protein YdbT with pleckstrin-like domain
LARRIERVRTPGERIVSAARADLRGWLVGKVPEIIVVFALVALAEGSGVRLAQWLARGVAIVVLVDLVVQYLRSTLTTYLLTDHRVMRFSGVVATRCEWMAWVKVTDVSVERSLVDRLVGTATLRIHSANEHSSLAEFTVPASSGFIKAVATLVNLRQGAVSLHPGPPAPRTTHPLWSRDD